MGETRRREFVVRGHNYLDILNRLRVGMPQSNFKETLKSTETSVMFYEERQGFWEKWFPTGDAEFVTVTATPVGEDTYLRILTETSARDIDKLMERAIDAVGREVPLEEAKPE